jgi:shikimate kinase
MVTGGARIPSFRRLLLVGFMGSGKSTVGARLASELGWEYADLD